MTARLEPGLRGGDGAEENGDPQADEWRWDFRLLMGGSALSQLGTLGAGAANPLLALALTNSPIVAGWVAAASTLPGLVLHLPAGLIADRCDRWWLMLRSQVIRVINSLVLVVGLVFFSAPWQLLVVAALVDGSCAVFFKIAELAAVRHVVPDGEAENAMGENEARHHLAVVLGRPTGGLLFALGRWWPYVADAATSAVSIGTLLAMKRRRLQSFSSTRVASFRRAARKAPSYLMKGFRWIAGDGFLALSLIACSIANMGFQVVILLLVVEAERQNINGSFIGGLLAISGLAGFAGAVTAPRVVRRWHPRRTIKWCVVSWFPFLVVVAASGNPFIGLPAWGLCSFAGAYINVALAVYQSKNVPEDMLGRVEGVVQFLTTGAVALGASAGGYLIDTFGTRSTARLVVALFLLPLIATLFATSSRRFCAVAGVRRRAARGRPTVANHDVVAAPRAVRSPDPTLGAGVSRRR